MKFAKVAKQDDRTLNKKPSAQLGDVHSQESSRHIAQGESRTLNQSGTDLRPQNILTLQRSIGNKAVLRLLNKSNQLPTLISDANQSHHLPLAQRTKSVHKQDIPAAVVPPVGVHYSSPHQEQLQRVALDYEDKGVETDENAGYRWVINWKLEDSDETTNGFIVQEVHDYEFVRHCDHERKNKVDNTYYEAWQVVKGRIFIKPPQEKKEEDMQTEDVPAQEAYDVWYVEADKSNVKIKGFSQGKAKFLPSNLATDVASWQPGAVKEAAHLRSSKTAPQNWNSGEPLERLIAMDYVYCPPTHTYKLTVNNETQMIVNKS